jgi:hypothetical protein
LGEGRDSPRPFLFSPPLFAGLACGTPEKGTYGNFKGPPPAAIAANQMQEEIRKHFDAPHVQEKVFLLTFNRAKLMLLLFV